MLPAGGLFTEAGLHRIEGVLDGADFEQVVAAWAVKERLRAILDAKVVAAENARIDVEMPVAAADMAETDKLAAAVAKSSKEIKILVRTRVTNTPLKSDNTGIKHIKRRGRGVRNQKNHQSRILGTSVRQTRRLGRILHQQGLQAQR